MKRIQLLGRLLVAVLLAWVPLAAGHAAASAHAAASITITLQMWSGPEGVAMRPIVARWNAQMGPKTGIHVVETEPSRDGYDALITSQLLSRSGTPDIVFPFNWDIPRVAKAGTLVDLTPYIKKNPAGFKMNDFFRVAVDAANLDGHQYALPLDMSLPILYYRKDLIKTPPATWDAFLKLAEQFTRSHNSKSPTLYGTTLYGRTGRAEPAQLWEEMYWPHGGQLMDAGFHSTIANQAGVKATMVGRTLVAHADVPQPATNYEYPQVLAALTNGSVAFVQEWNAAWGQIIDKSMDPQYYNKISYAPIPGIKVGGKIVRYYHVHTINLAVNASSKHVAAAVQVLTWLLRPDVAIAYTEAGGNTPRRSIFSSPAVAKIRGAGFQSFLAHAVACCGKLEPKIAEMPDIDDLIMNKYLNAAWAGQMPPMTALSKAQGEINALLKKDGVQK